MGGEGKEWGHENINRGGGGRAGPSCAYERTQHPHAPPAFAGLSGWSVSGNNQVESQFEEQARKGTGEEGKG